MLKSFWNSFVSLRSLMPILQRFQVAKRNASHSLQAKTS